jgi:hypothetical protein
MELWKKKKEEIFLDSSGPFPLPLSSGPSVAHSSPLTSPLPRMGRRHALGPTGAAAGAPSLFPSATDERNPVVASSNPLQQREPRVRARRTPWPHSGVGEDERTGAN